MIGLFNNRSFVLIAPYAVWIGMMSFLPATAFWYAVRAALTAALLFVALPRRPVRMCASGVTAAKAAMFGIISGLAVFFIWIAPEVWLGFGSGGDPVSASPYDPAVCGWFLTATKLLASAFVISIAEELFFRVWLVEFAGFFWMVALFAVEHGERWPVGAIASVAYGLMAKRFGVFSAIVAHSVTNLVLGLWVILKGQWQFW